MANFELTGYIKSIKRIGGKPLVTVSEYIQGRRGDDGQIVGERMEHWRIFFPATAARHINYFKAGDLVIAKGTVHIMTVGEFPLAMNGESIKHFIAVDLNGDLAREKASKKHIDEPIQPHDIDNDF